MIEHCFHRVFLFGQCFDWAVLIGRRFYWVCWSMVFQSDKFGGASVLVRRAR